MGSAVVSRFDIPVGDPIAFQVRFSIKSLSALLELSLVPTAARVYSPLLSAHVRKQRLDFQS